MGDIPDNVSDTSSIDDRPVYFHMFTRESLAKIRQRIEHEIIMKSDQLPKPEVTTNFTIFELLPILVAFVDFFICYLYSDTTTTMVMTVRIQTQNWRKVRHFQFVYLLLLMSLMVH